MADTVALTVAFLRRHAEQAASVLGAAPREQLADLLQQLPARVLGPVLAEMQPRLVAGLLAELPAERGAELLEGAGAQAAVLMLRHVDEGSRRQLLDLLPTAQALTAALLLRFPEDSVGALADPAVVSVSPGASVASALDKLRTHDTSADRIFVIDAAHDLIGQVLLQQLLRAPDSAHVDTLCRTPVAALSASTPVGGALLHPAWQSTSLLPVVERGARLVGVLGRDALERAQARAQRLAAPVDGADTFTGVMVRGYWNGLANLVSTSLTLLPTVEPVAGARHER